MQVPQLDQSVGLEAPQVAPARQPNVIPGAFGGDVAAGVQKAGEEGVRLADAVANHIAKENFWKGQAAIANSALQVRNQFQDMAYSTDQVPKQAAPVSNTAPMSGAANAAAATGIETQPKGYLNRQGFNANGVTEEFINNAMPMRDSFMSQFKGSPKLQEIAAKQFDEIYNSYYDQVSKHEATQYRTGMNNTFGSATLSTISTAAQADSPQSLMAGIQQITQATTKQLQYKGADPDTINNTLQNNIATATSKAVVNKLQATGDLAQAKAMLDSVKDQIPADRYDKIDSMLTTGFQRLQQQGEIASKQKQISGQASLLGQLAAGKGGWMNLDDMASLVQQGAVSEKFAKAYSDVIAAKGNYNPREDQNENVPKFIDAIYKAPDQDTLHSTLINMMEQHKDMSQDEMAILINSALKRSGSLPLSAKFPSQGTADPKQQNVDAGAMSVVNFGRRNNLTPDEISFMYGSYYNKTAKGMPVPQAMQEATHAYAISKYPAVATMEGTPTAIATPSAGVKYLHFNSNTTVEPARVWNPKTGVFDVNTNRAQSAKGDKKEE